MEMSALARSATDLALRFTIAYSVTTYIMSDRGAVTMFPAVSSRTIRLLRIPFFS